MPEIHSHRCQKCDQPAPEGNDWCASCEDANAREVAAMFRSLMP